MRQCKSEQVFCDEHECNQFCSGWLDYDQSYLYEIGCGTVVCLHLWYHNPEKMQSQPQFCLNWIHHLVTLSTSGVLACLASYWTGIGCNKSKRIIWHCIMSNMYLVHFGGTEWWDIELQGLQDSKSCSVAQFMFSLWVLLSCSEWLCSIVTSSSIFENNVYSWMTNWTWYMQYHLSEDCLESKLPPTHYDTLHYLDPWESKIPFPSDQYFFHLHEVDNQVISSHLDQWWQSLQNHLTGKQNKPFYSLVSMELNYTIIHVYLFIQFTNKINLFICVIRTACMYILIGLSWQLHAINNLTGTKKFMLWLSEQI